MRADAHKIFPAFMKSKLVGLNWLCTFGGHKFSNMNKTRIILMGCMGVAVLGFLGNHNGVAEQQNKDRTGAPGSQPVCSACHSGGNFDVSPFVMLTDLDNTTEFMTYAPGETYLMHFILNEGTGNAEGFGLQSTVIDASGASVGSFSNPSANGQLEFANNRNIFEQNDLSTSNTFTVEWTAPAAGAGEVTVYYAGIAANGNGGTAGDALFTGNMSWAEGASNVDDLTAMPIQVAALPGQIAITGGEVAPDHTIEVYNMLGRQVAEARRSNLRESLSTSGWTAGTYIVRVGRGAGSVPAAFRVYVH